MFQLIDHLRTKVWACIFVIYLRYLLGAAYVFAGWGKALGGRFLPAGTLQLPPGEGISIDLFFESLYRTGLWWTFLGSGQALAGALLMTQRFSTLGAVAFLPVSLNIFLITLSMDFHGTPLLTGLMLAGNLGLLLWDYMKLKPILFPNQAGELVIPVWSDQLGVPRYWLGLGFILLVTSMSFGNREDIGVWVSLCLLEGLVGWFVFLIVHSRRKRLAHPLTVDRKE